MTAEQALRFLAREIQVMGDRDRVESAVLLIGPIAKAMDLPPMDDFEAKAFFYQLKQELIGKNAYQHAA